MGDTTTVEFWIAMDANADWGYGLDQDDAVDNYTSNYAVTGPLRLVPVHVIMNPPVIPDPVSVTVPDEASQTVTAEVA